MAALAMGFSKLVMRSCNSGNAQLPSVSPNPSYGAITKSCLSRVLPLTSVGLDVHTSAPSVLQPQVLTKPYDLMLLRFVLFEEVVRYTTASTTLAVDCRLLGLRRY